MPLSELQEILEMIFEEDDEWTQSN
jgi:hypothetical protein